METAGLTNGAFYKHFESKDQLIQEALKIATGNVEDRFSDSETLIRTYLSPEHIKALEWGCPIVGIGSELSRTDEETRTVATEGIKQLISFLEKRIEAPVEERRKIALVTLSIMVGGATLSKIVDDIKLAKDILTSTKKVAIEFSTKK